MSEGAKRYQPETVAGRVAAAVEDYAGQTFAITSDASRVERSPLETGPIPLVRNEVARALNLDAEQITDAEWAEIEEFSVHAGAELIARALEHEPLPQTEKEEEKFEQRLFANKQRMFPIHDLFHAAEAYRATHAEAVTTPFVEVPLRERYTDPRLIRSELWPVLFLIAKQGNAPVSVLLSMPEGRAELSATFGEGGDRPNPVRREISELLANPPPEDPDALQREYERLVGLMVIANAIDKLPDIVESEVDALRAEAARVGEDRDPAYADFAMRVFSGEWRDNPRLFLDELLAAIRTMPVSAER